MPQPKCANTKQGPAGLWGDEPVRSVYAGRALYVDTIARCLEALWDVLGPDTTPYVLQALARAAMEAAAVLVYLRNRASAAAFSRSRLLRVQVSARP